MCRLVHSPKLEHTFGSTFSINSQLGDVLHCVEELPGIIQLSFFLKPKRVSRFLTSAGALSNATRSAGISPDGLSTR